jgi:fluoride exporter
VLTLAGIAVGSALGGMARYALSGFVARVIGETFPWGTLVVNASGSLAIGVVAALVAPDGLFPGDATLWRVAAVGLCGGYTTFSSFSLQTLSLARDGEGLRALANIVASVAICLLCVWTGFALGAFMSGG